jgi:hypothetical protein
MNSAIAPIEISFIEKFFGADLGGKRGRKRQILPIICINSQNSVFHNFIETAVKGQEKSGYFS